MSEENTIINLHGPQGIQGAQGYQGIKGAQGMQGLQGVQGKRGERGLQGLRGAQGYQGIEGTQGLQGAQGIQGIQGIYGCQGPTGAQGAQGERGYKGSTGAKGAQGFTGDRGPQGERGAQGAQGKRGEKGYMGYRGQIGEVGIQGLQGEKGHIWVDGISLDGYNTHLFNLVDNKFVSVDSSKLTLNNGAKMSFWLDQNVYDYLLNNNCQITVDNNTKVTIEGVESFETNEVTTTAYYGGDTLLIDIINPEKDLNKVVEIIYYNDIWYYVGGIVNNSETNVNPDEPIQPEIITYTGGNGIDINNNVINVKISAIDNNSLQLTENGELYVPQVEIPEVVEYSAGNGIEITEDSKINVTISDVENNVLTTDENGKLYVPQVEIPEQIEYTSGDGINISEDNKINVIVSEAENNTLQIDENGKLFVPQVEIPEQEPISCIQNFITKDLTDIIEVTYWGLDEELNLIQVEDGMAIEPGHKYLVIITTDGKMYWVENDDKDTDTYVTGFNLLLNENNEQILRITLNNNTVYDIPTSNFIIPVEEQYNVISLDQDSEFVKVNVIKNDEDKQYELKTSIKTVPLFDLPEDENGLVTAQDIKEYVKWYVLEQFKKTHPDAEVYYDETEDTIVINKEGTIGPDDLEEIENYIDNANMGTY